MTTKENWQQIKELFHFALELAPAERAVYLDTACAGNDSLRQEVESLLQVHEKAGDFIDSPAYELAAEMLASGEEFKSGDTLGHYQIRHVLGQGGMGRVYLAEDTKLKRNVALKVLPLSNAGDEETRRRMLREARAAAALDHPNICAIYEVGEESGRSYIAMQYLKGETLDARMMKGRLSCNDALQIAMQVADALADAHAHNIVHRDIKPANVLLTDRGQAKVLDFGLAKIVSESFGATGEANTNSLLTQPGMIVGTVPYMSPEQVRSEPVDARSDIFSFGIVLYEMLSGRRAFVRASVAETISAILSQDPPAVAEFNDSVPDELQRIVMKALKKDRNARYQNVHEMLDDLRKIEMGATGLLPAKLANRSSHSDQGKTILIPETTADGTRVETNETERRSLPGAESRIKSKTWKVIIGLISLVAVTAVAFALWRFLPGRPDSSPKPATLRATQVTTWTGLDIYPAVSPNGNEIAYSSDHDGSFEIYVKPLTPGSRERQITSDEQQNFQPAFSPDGQSIAFYSKTRGGIWVVPAPGGRARQITAFGSDPAWSPDGGLIAFQSDALTDLGAQASPAQPPSTIWVVSPTGNAEPTRITQTSSPLGGHGAPAWSPDGQRIVFCVSDYAATSVWTVSSTGGEAKQIVNYAFDPVYAPDGESIYYGTLLGLWQIRVSPSSGEPVGEPEQLTSGSAEKLRHFAFSADGKKIAYTALLTNSNIWSVPLASASNEEVGPPVPLTQNRTFRNALPAFSPDGKRIAFNTQSAGRQGADGDIWLMDADGKNATQVTTAGGALPSWFPDGEQIAFLSTSRDPRKAWFTNLKTGQDRPLLDFGEEVNYMKLSPDGKQIVFNSKKSGTINVWKISVAGGAPKQLTFDKEMIGFTCWSPDVKTFAVQIKRGDDTNIGTMPSDGGEITQLTFDKGQSWTHSFSPDGDKILFAGFRKGYWNVFWVSRSTKQQRQLTHYRKLSAFVRYPAWSPLGNQIAYEYAETTGNIWVADLK